MSIRLGRISYLNVLPIYHPLESGKIEHDFSFVYGPPAQLNRLMDKGEIEFASASSIEYARHWERYYLVPDISIGSRGPVQSVLLLSQCPVKKLDGETILVSAQTHTSYALLKVLLAELWGIKTEFTTDDATALLNKGERPAAILCIGDEALNLRHHPDYPHRIDLGEAWRELTGLPFIFGVWIVQREAFHKKEEALRGGCEKLLESKRWGVENLKSICVLAAEDSMLNHKEVCSYFDGLAYDLGEEEQKGMKLFYSHLVKAGIIDKVPPLDFIPT